MTPAAEPPAERTGPVTAGDTRKGPGIRARSLLFAEAALAGGLLLLSGVLRGALAGILQCLGHLVQGRHVLAVPLVAELVRVRALPVRRGQDLVQRVALVLDLVRNSLQLAAQVLQLGNICTPNSHLSTP